MTIGLNVFYWRQQDNVCDKNADEKQNWIHQQRSTWIYTRTYTFTYYFSQGLYVAANASWNLSVTNKEIRNHDAQVHSKNGDKESLFTYTLKGH